MVAHAQLFQNMEEVCYLWAQKTNYAVAICPAAGKGLKKTK